MCCHFNHHIKINAYTYVQSSAVLLLSYALSTACYLINSWRNQRNLRRKRPSPCHDTVSITIDITEVRLLSTTLSESVNWSSFQSRVRYIVSMYILTLICSCNLNNSSLSYSTCCCSRSSDDWKYQVTPNSRTRLTTDSTKLTTNITFLLSAAITATTLE